MTIFEYLKMSYLRPNPFVLKGLGASNDLITYLRKTPENTNMNVVKSMIENSSETSDLVIFDNTITLTESSVAGVYSTLINTSFTYEDFLNVPDSVMVEIGGQVIELPHIQTNFGVAYGDMDDDWAGLKIYPVWIWINEDGSGEIATNTFTGEQKVIIRFPQESDLPK